MLLSKEELPGEVGCFDMVGVSHNNFPFRPHVDHGKVLEQFAANSPSPNYKCFQLLHLLDTCPPHCDLQPPEGFTGRNCKCLEFVFLGWHLLLHLVEVEGKELFDRHVLVCQRLDGFL